MIFQAMQSIVGHILSSKKLWPNSYLLPCPNQKKKKMYQVIQFISYWKRETPVPFNQGFEIGISKESQVFCVPD